MSLGKLPSRYNQKYHSDKIQQGQNTGAGLLVCQLLSLQCVGKLFCCLSWNPGHENWEKLWNPGQNFPLMLSVSWIPRHCLFWNPRQYCYYNDAFAAALWFVRWFCMINIGMAEQLESSQFYFNGNCFDWHEKSQSTNRDTHDWYQNCSMSSKNCDDLVVCSKLVLIWKCVILVC